MECPAKPCPQSAPGWGRGQGTGSLSTATRRGRVSLLRVPSSQENPESAFGDRSQGSVGTFLEEAAAELENGWEIGRWDVALRFLGGPGEVEMGLTKLCAWISSQ